jgi:predicted transglutaminase-like protease
MWTLKREITVFEITHRQSLCRITSEFTAQKKLKQSRHDAHKNRTTSRYIKIHHKQKQKQKQNEYDNINIAATYGGDKPDANGGRGQSATHNSRQ